MTCGIYRIFNNIVNKSYIGSSIDIEKRWKGHTNALKAQTHRNIHLQRSYNKYGIESFSFSILEETAKDILLKREKYWMNFYSASNKKFGYNIYKDPTNPGYRKGDVPVRIRDIYGKSRLVSFVSPEGIIYKDIKNVTRFSEEHGLLPVGMNEVARGKRIVNRGWTKFGNTVLLSKSGVRKRRPGKFNIKLINDFGEIFHIMNLQQFCEENNLKYTTIHNLIHGVCKTSCGFKLLNN